MNLKNHYKLGSVLLLILSTISTMGFIFRGESEKLLIQSSIDEVEVLKQKLSNFTLNDGEEYKLINSALKKNYTISFSGKIIDFDTLVIGKGDNRYLSSFIIINRDSIIFNRITRGNKQTSIKHDLKLTNNLGIDIERSLKSTVVTIINEGDTLKIDSDFTGMNSPFVRSSGSTIQVNNFEFKTAEYDADVFIFGDSYVNCASPERWPYYIYNQDLTFLCDGLPGGKSNDAYDFMVSAFSVHKPQYAIWCLGMNDGSDEQEANPKWKSYVQKVVDLCERNNVTLILSTVPTVPSRNHEAKNKIVRQSGYRYIDFDKAISDGKGNWNEGLLAKDGVHPSRLGAEAMANAFIKDFPEIKNYK
ncbi:Lysophospholipase L1 [Spirosomataceae bacterium TFI 002]|nr:Lysophospholipase L1 [Spirosomataceae bacterium TFI 002]